MIGYFLYKFSEVLLKAIIKANRENRKGIQSHTVFLQWVASSQNMPPCAGKECRLLRHQQLRQIWAGRKLFLRAYEEILFSVERYFYGRLEKCLEIKYVLLSLCAEAKWIHGYFIAWETKLCLQACSSTPSRAATIKKGPAPWGWQDRVSSSLDSLHTHTDISWTNVHSFPKGRTRTQQITVIPDYLDFIWKRTRCHRCINVFKKVSQLSFQ